ncbi:Rgp1-domain-containing protein [Sarocladium strictum]
MALSDDATNIRVFVRWHDQTVFSGEEVKCTITFKNVAPLPGQSRHASGQQSHAQSERNRLGASLAGRSKANAGLTPPSAATGRGHRRSALSLSIPPSSSRSRSGSIQWPSSQTGSADTRPGHAHKRSVSIVSIGSASTIDGHQRRESMGAPHPPPASAQRPGRGHSRSASLQIVPRGPQSPLAGPSSGTSLKASPRASPNPMPEFRFPAAPPPESENHREPARSPEEGLLSPSSGGTETGHFSPRQQHGQQSLSERPTPAARILSSTSLASGTPRSSGEFYSVSNNSSETLASEYVTAPARGQVRPPHLRRSSGFAPQQPRAPESLMMGYAQIQGSFSLDGSLVSLTPFEQVKKKAVVGGRGGGVVGLEPMKRDNGLLRGFGWGNISSSLGDLLGGGELSTIKEMRGVANSKSIPLLTTPQSILFVDLQLAPGETKVFEYSFKLPRGLPPTHKGKAVKISYSLVIGTQRAGGVKEQQVRSVEAPFRVLGSVNSGGEILGHDMMTPYVLLRDEAQVVQAGRGGKKANDKTNGTEGPASTLNSFLNYVDELVNRPRHDFGGSLLSPTAGTPTRSRRPSAMDDVGSSKEAIDLAIMRSNLTADGQQSPNRFEIARNGQKVGVVMLTRPAYRLGEVVTMVIDFADVDVPCYAVHTSLETSEKVDQSLAVRSESSIHRVTRKVYAASSEATLYSRRVVFTPTIPITATPEFVTSGVSLEWKIRVEFVVPSTADNTTTNNGDEDDGTATPGGASSTGGGHPLLEQISQDEKGGLVLAAVENLRCESFDVPVPLRVYGAVGTGLEKLERDEASDEGLVV